MTVVLKAASKLKSSVPGKLFHIIFTIVFAKKFVLALLVYSDWYNLYA